MRHCIMSAYLNGSIAILGHKVCNDMAMKSMDSILTNKTLHLSSKSGSKQTLLLNWLAFEGPSLKLLSHIYTVKP